MVCRVRFFAGALTCLALLSVPHLPAQSSSQRHTTTASAPDPVLAPLLAAQQQALSSGDPATVAAASRPLAAAALRRLALLEQNAGRSAQANLLRTRADALGPAPSSPTNAPPPRDRAALEAILAGSFTDLGTAEARQREYAAALSDFLEAGHWSPPSASLLRNIGIAAFRIENYTEAARALRAYCSSLAPGSTDQAAELMLAMSLYSLGDFYAATGSFAQVPAALEQDPRAAYAYAFSLARIGQQREANALALRLQASSLPPDALSLVCHLFHDTESYEQAVTCYRKVYSEDPSARLAHYQVGEALLRLDRPSQAIPELRDELTHLPEDDPHRSDVQYSLAFALLQTSQKDEAETLLQQVLQTNPANAQAQFELGKLLLERNDLPGAIQHLEAAEINNPKADYIHYQLQLAYRKAGRTADATREVALYRDLKSKARAAATPATK